MQPIILFLVFTVRNQYHVHHHNHQANGNHLGDHVSEAVRTLFRLYFIDNCKCLQQEIQEEVAVGEEATFQRPAVAEEEEEVDQTSHSLVAMGSHKQQGNKMKWVNQQCFLIGF